MSAAPQQIGIDLGGSKIAAIAFSKAGTPGDILRTATPRHDYAATLDASAELIARLEKDTADKKTATIGIAMPGSLDRASNTVQNANSTWLNGKPFQADLEQRLNRPVRLANDANCFALSEAHDGAARGAKSVFGVILGTGCGGGLVVDGQILTGAQNIAGEWGHNPLPWQTRLEAPGPKCWCGRNGCLELWVSGSGLERDHWAETGIEMPASMIAATASAGDPDAARSLERHAERLARGLAHVVNLFDPEVIVLGGGLSNLDHLYSRLPGLMRPWIFAQSPEIDLRRPQHGDASGVRGAARLWPRSARPSGNPAFTT